MTMMLLGLGGSWLAVFGTIAAASYHVLAIAGLVLIFAWYISIKRGSLKKLSWWLVSSTALTVMAWGIVLNETRINDFMIGLM